MTPEKGRLRDHGNGNGRNEKDRLSKSEMVEEKGKEARVAKNRA